MVDRTVNSRMARYRERLKAQRARRKLEPCGTAAAAKRHRRAHPQGKLECEACIEAERDYTNGYRAEKKSYETS